MKKDTLNCNAQPLLLTKARKTAYSRSSRLFRRGRGGVQTLENFVSCPTSKRAQPVLPRPVGGMEQGAVLRALWHHHDAFKP